MKFSKKIVFFSLFLCLTLPLSGFAALFSAFAETGSAAPDGKSAESKITDMNLQGYVGKKLDGNIEKWQIDAYRNNKNIVEQIRRANSDSFSLDMLFGYDWFGVDSRYEIDISSLDAGVAENYFDGLICYSPKIQDAYRGDAGWRLDTNLYRGVTDWTGADEIWIYVDASDFGADLYLRVNFEEGEVDENGNKTGAWEAYTPSQGQTARLISDTDGSVSETTYLWYSNDTLEGAGLGDAFFKIAKGFRGFLAYPLDNSHFWRYAGEGNNVIDKKDVHQITLSVGGATAATVGRKVYFGFGATGPFADGVNVPFDLGAHEDDKFINVLPLPLTTYVLDMNLYVGAYVGSLYNDWDVTVDKNSRGFQKKALSWKQKAETLPGGTFDRDVQFGKDPAALTDWTGAKELLVYIDASETESETLVRIAFEEQHAGRESFSLIEGSTVVLYKNGEDTYRARSVQVTGGGYVPLPAHFAGTVRLKLDDTNFTRYWDDNGNGVLDLDRVVQFQMSVRGGADSVGKTVYMDDFEIVGEVNGERLDRRSYLGSNPADGENPDTAWKYFDPSYTRKTVWDLENVERKNTNTGSVMIWYGEFVGKLLTGMAYSYKASPSDELLAAANEIIDDLSAAQGEDGYLGVFTGDARFAVNADNWDLWNHYHCVTGLLEWYKITGNEKALETAVNALDCIYGVFHERSYLVAGGFETNRAIAHGYAQAYQITGDERYLTEAMRIINQDCRDENGWYNKALSGGDFYTSSSNRWEVLHMIMTLGILFEETGYREYYDVMSAVWESVLKTDIHNDGGFTTNEGAQGDPYMNGVIETCCTVAWMAFSNEYLKYSKSVRVADEIERSYLNGMLGSLLDNEKYCSYNTPMNGFAGSSGAYDGRRVPSQQDIAFQYNSGSPDMNCCQANLARGLGQIAEWAALSEENSLYLNYYGPCGITTFVGGKSVTVLEETNYPASGAVRLTVTGADQIDEFALKLRIPTYSDGASVTFGGRTFFAAPGAYFTLEGFTEEQCTVDIDILLHYTYWAGEKSKTNYVSVYYGPVLLALDNTAEQGVIPSAVQIESAVPSAPADRSALLTVNVDADGGTLRLTSFADAGKYGGSAYPASYLSWIKVTGAPAPSEGVTWTNEASHAVICKEGIVCGVRRAFAGDRVEFTVQCPAGKTLERIEASVESLAITNEDGLFSFEMPNEAVTIEAVFILDGNVSAYDINGDGNIDIRDVTALLNVLAGDESLQGADLSGDGIISISDVTALLNFLSDN